MSHIQLDKINPKFRQLTDLLFFSERMDLSLSDYKGLLKSNYAEHLNYIWNKFQRSSEIFWENGDQFWYNRLSFLFSLGDKKLTQDIESYLEKRMFNLIRAKVEINIKYDVEYLQYLQLCKVKKRSGANFTEIKKQLTDLPSHVKADKLMNIINSFIPVVFENIEEYVDLVSKKITQSARNFDLLKSLELQGMKFDKFPMVKLTKEILIERSFTIKNRRAFFTMLNDKDILNQFKKEYQSTYRDRLLNLLDKCDYQEIEDQHLRNIKNLIELDESIADDLAAIYANKLYARNTGHKKANADRLIRLMKMFPQIVPKKMLAYLSANNKISDIKYILTEFPNLKKLAAFV